MRVVTIANAKGGVGKTNLALHAAHYLAEKRRVLVVDLDQQHSALSEPMRALASPVDAVAMFDKPTYVPPAGNLTLAARTSQLEAIEREDPSEMAEMFRASLRLCSEHYDAVVIDTPPAFGVRTSAALLVSDQLCIPVQLHETSLEAVGSVLNHVAAVCGRFNKPVPDFTRQRPLLVSGFDTRSARQRQWFADLAHKVGRIVIEGKIVTRDAYARTWAEAVPVWDLRDAHGRVSGGIRAASEEMRGVLGEVERMMEFGA